MSRADPGNAGEAGCVEAATTPGADVGKVFSRAVRNIQSTMTPTDAVVDVEITFRSVTIDSRGIPLFTNRTEQSSMEMKLATRVRPAQPPPPTPDSGRRRT